MRAIRSQRIVTSTNLLRGSGESTQREDKRIIRSVIVKFYRLIRNSRSNQCILYRLSIRARSIGGTDNADIEIWRTPCQGGRGGKVAARPRGEFCHPGLKVKR
jgi:hypothetical protein